VLILDEATSALDEKTEAAVMAAIARENPDITILIAAHRPSALSLCDRIVRFEKGRLVEDRPAAGQEKADRSVKSGSAG
jgi:ABC-type multidrug transport system fused ATPase/permease subunit